MRVRVLKKGGDSVFSSGLSPQNSRVSTETTEPQ
jgi:hypothetical protein